MPDLMQSLQGRDLGHLRIIAQLWEIELQTSDSKNFLEQLVRYLTNRQNLSQIIEELPQPARHAWEELLSQQGRLPWAHFVRRYGEVRAMGPAKRDRERPYLPPNTAAEALWYRALIARSFLDTASGPEEFAYIPDDLYILSGVDWKEDRLRLGKPAAARDQSFQVPANDLILDDACTLLAALRISASQGEVVGHFLRDYFQPEQIPVFLTHLLGAAGMLDQDHLPVPDAVRTFLEAPRPAALAQLAHSWLQSQEINELHLIPGLSFEGEWSNNPYRARQRVLEFLLSTQEGGNGDNQANTPFIGLDSFIRDIRENVPDIQRSGGEYDSWFIRDLQTGQYLRGFESWDRIEGVYLRYLLLGPFHWLGMIDLATRADPEQGGQIGFGATPAIAFRLSKWATDLFRNQSPRGLEAESALILVFSDGRIDIPRLTPRSARYQIARFATWEGCEKEAYRYRLAPAAFKRAAGQGLKGSHLAALLRRHSDPIPPSILRAIDRWDEFGNEAAIESALLLRVRNPDLLPALRASRAARFLGEALSPGVILLRKGGEATVLSVLLELGYFGEAQIDGSIYHEKKSPE